MSRVPGAAGERLLQTDRRMTSTSRILRTPVHSLRSVDRRIFYRKKQPASSFVGLVYITILMMVEGRGVAWQRPYSGDWDRTSCVLLRYRWSLISFSLINKLYYYKSPYNPNCHLLLLVELYVLMN